MTIVVVVRLLTTSSPSAEAELEALQRLADETPTDCLQVVVLVSPQLFPGESPSALTFATHVAAYRDEHKLTIPFAALRVKDEEKLFGTTDFGARLVARADGTIVAVGSGLPATDSALGIAEYFIARSTE